MKSDPLPYIKNRYSTKIEKAGRSTRKPVKKFSLTDSLLKNHRWIYLFLSSLIILLQAIEHWLFFHEINLYFFGETVFVLLLLGVTWYITKKLLLSIQDRAQTNNILRLKQEVGWNLAAGRDITDVSDRLVKQVALIVPAADIELYLWKPDEQTFVLEAQKELTAKDSSQKSIPFRMAEHPCWEIITEETSKLHSHKTCLKEDFIKSKGKQGFCLPLIQIGEPVGLLHIYFDTRDALTYEQIDQLENISVEMSQALAIAVEKKILEEKALTQQIQAIQLEIARDIHDTIGQSISFLRMKLDHLSETEQQTSMGLKPEINSMLKVANESYDMVRGTLDVLQSGSLINPLIFFSQYSAQIEERSGFRIIVSSKGAPTQLSPNQARQVFFVFREALCNIEKHAHASKVSVELVWNGKDLTLTISDDGQGFSLEEVPIGNHYGLQFMRERIESIMGSFLVQSTPGVGTRISISLPVEKK